MARAWLAQEKVVSLMMNALEWATYVWLKGATPSVDAVELTKIVAVNFVAQNLETQQFAKSAQDVQLIANV